MSKVTHRDPYDEPTEACPYCGEEMRADFVDNGVGMVQCGPYHCYKCNASEIGPEIDDWYYKDREGETIHLPGKRKYYSFLRKGRGGKTKLSGRPLLRYDAPFTNEELRTGYYKGKISPYANTVSGNLIDHKTAKKAYDIGLLDDKNI